MLRCLPYSELVSLCLRYECWALVRTNSNHWIVKEVLPAHPNGFDPRGHRSIVHINPQCRAEVVLQNWKLWHDRDKQEKNRGCGGSPGLSAARKDVRTKECD